MNKKTTIYDIARALGVTVSTVSRALNNVPTISEATRKLVLDKAKELNYSVNKLASSLSSGKSNTIGVIVPTMQIHFFAEAVHSIEKELKKHNYSLLLYQSNESFEDEVNGVKTLLEAQVDGIIASLSLETQETSHFQEVINQRKCLIIFDRTHKNIPAPVVKLDDFKAGYLATQHLIEQDYRNIAFITTDKEIAIFQDRFHGFEAALKEAQLPQQEEFIVRGDLSIEAGIKGTEQILKSEIRPDAFIGGDDFTAVGIIQALKSANIAIPATGVIGFANQTFSSFITPTLSSIDQQANKMGEECAKLFLKMVKQKNPYEAIEQIVLDPLLVKRKSTNRIDK
ncbi:LacI family DNA-binding transcriptional regulator [Sphingobacterium sp. 40-24]|uniref:LacI family DNA-binding transcriptional regulator n=1 Tax=Sphingobacterium sp. 40-24 TaxID=1895843 RepID=UPI00095A67D6|nr:LacI family DNA-binding transcriptional regulator [Sphingobacterium sp. 40-24]OJZ06506.1 MAG: LacI family transcriptional regulator [Sphingobacterium sp. 40-24]